MSPDSLELRREDGARAAYPLDTVETLWVRSGSSKPGAITGGVVGGLAGGAVGLALTALASWGSSDVDAGTAVGLVGGGVLAGGLLGAGIGGMIGQAVPKWTQVCSNPDQPCSGVLEATGPDDAWVPVEWTDPDPAPDQAGAPGPRRAVAPRRLASLILGPTLDRDLDRGRGGTGFRVTLLLPQDDGPSFGPEIAAYGTDPEGTTTHVGLAVCFPIGSGKLSGYGVGGPGLYIFPHDTFGGINGGGGLLFSLGRNAAMTGELRGHWSLPTSDKSFRMGTLLFGIAFSW